MSQTPVYRPARNLLQTTRTKVNAPVRVRGRKGKEAALVNVAYADNRPAHDIGLTVPIR